MKWNSRYIGVIGALAGLVGVACSSSGDEAGQPAAVDEAAGAQSVSLATREDVGRLSLGEALTVRAEGGLNPTAAVDPMSKAVYLAWAQEVASAAPGEGADPILQALVARSDDGGRTFGEPVVASSPFDRVTSSTVAPTQLGVGPEGEVYLLYGHSVPGADAKIFEYGRTLLHLVRSTDGGRTFSPAVELGGEKAEGAFTTTGMHNLFVAPDGDLYVSWLDDRELVAALVAHQGKPAPAGGHDEAEEPPVHLRVARSGDGGRTFAPSTLVAKPTCQCCGTKVAQGREGPLFATTRSDWRELKGSKDAVRDPFLATSGDDGSTWSETWKIHDDGFKISGCPDISPGMAVDGKGRLHAAWYTGTEKAPGPGVYHAVSEDQGRTFSEPAPLLVDTWVPYGDVKLAIDATDHAWVAFEDRRGDQDVIRLVRLAPDGTVEVSSAWPGSAPDVMAAGETAIVTWSSLPPSQEGEESHQESGGVQVLVASPAS